SAGEPPSRPSRVLCGPDRAEDRRAGDGEAGGHAPRAARVPECVAARSGHPEPAAVRASHAPSGEMTTATHEFVMKCWTRDELDTGLRAAGFETVEYSTGYEDGRPTGAGDRIVAATRLGMR